MKKEQRLGIDIEILKRSKAAKALSEEAESIFLNFFHKKTLEGSRKWAKYD